MNRVKLLTEDQAAEVLGIGKVTLYRLRRDRLISCYRVRGRTLFSDNHLTDYLTRVEQKADGQKSRSSPNV